VKFMQAKVKSTEG